MWLLLMIVILFQFYWLHIIIVCNKLPISLAIYTLQKQECVFHTESMLSVSCLHSEMSLGAYFQYEIYISLFAVY